MLDAFGGKNISIYRNLQDLPVSQQKRCYSDVRFTFSMRHLCFFNLSGLLTPLSVSWSSISVYNKLLALSAACPHGSHILDPIQNRHIPHVFKPNMHTQMFQKKETWCKSDLSIIRSDPKGAWQTRENTNTGSGMIFHLLTSGKMLILRLINVKLILQKLI